MNVALVIQDAEERLAAARAFDRAPAWWSVQLFDRVPDGTDVVVTGAGVEVAGAVPFDAEHPEDVVDRVRRRLAVQRSRCVIVTAALGGVGVTTIALHLSAVFARRARTCVVDLAGGVPDRLGIEVHRRWNGADDDDLLRCAQPVAGGFRVLPADDKRDAATLVRRARGHFDRVVVDAPQDVLPALQSVASAAIAVMPPSPRGLRRTASLLEQIPDLAWATVVNRQGPGGELNRSSLQRLLERHIALELPSCAALRDAEDRSQLCTSMFSRWNHGLERLARAVERSFVRVR